MTSTLKISRRVRIESWSNDEVAHQQLPSTTCFEERITKAKLRASETKASRSLRIVRLEASRIGGKLACEVNIAHMNNLQAVLYLAKVARVMST